MTITILFGLLLIVLGSISLLVSLVGIFMDGADNQIIGIMLFLISMLLIILGLNKLEILQ